MNSPTFVDFKIIITKEFTLQCFTIDEEGKENFIQLNKENIKEEYKPTVLFEKNIISICQEDEKSIEFVKKWIDQPEDFTEHQIQFKNKDFQLLPEVLFAILISEFKNRIDKDFIINDTIVEIPSRDCLITERMRTSLQSIGLKNVFINSFSYDYSKQEEQLNDLLEMKKEGDKCIKIIEKAIEMNPSAKEKIEEVRNKILNEENMNVPMIQEEINKHLSLEERKNMKLSQLDNYCVFIASRYFDSVDDHINLTFVSRRMRGNMEKFHYNPTSVNNETVKFFPNIETLHLYNEKDMFLEGGRIAMYCYWIKKSYHELNSIKRTIEGKNIEYKSLVWTREDSLNQLKGSKTDIHIPQCVNNLDENCFNSFNCLRSYELDLHQLTIPSSVTSIPKKCLENCHNLTNLTLPLNKSQVICNE